MWRPDPARAKTTRGRSVATVGSRTCSAAAEPLAQCSATCGSSTWPPTRGLSCNRLVVTHPLVASATRRLGCPTSASSSGAARARSSSTTRGATTQPSTPGKNFRRWARCQRLVMARARRSAPTVRCGSATASPRTLADSPTPARTTLRRELGPIERRHRVTYQSSAACTTASGHAEWQLVLYGGQTTGVPRSR